MRSTDNPNLVAVTPRLGLASQPAYAALVQFPAVCFIGALITDLAYLDSAMFIWETFSIWLLTAGCIMAGFTGVAALITWLSQRHVRALPYAGLHVVTLIVVLILSIINAFVHSRDGYTAVVPTGLTLSAVVVVLMLIATWLGWPRQQYVAVARPLHDAGAL